MAQKRLRLTDLQSGANFIPRHIGPRDDDITSMLKELGAKSLDDLIAKVVPENIRTTTALDLPPALSERNALSDLRRMGGRNQPFTAMIGMGYYGCVTPKVVLRRLMDENKISGIPIVQEKRVVGILTSRDLRFRTDDRAPVAGHPAQVAGAGRGEPGRASLGKTVARWRWHSDLGTGERARHSRRARPGPVL